MINDADHAAKVLQPLLENVYHAENDGQVSLEISEKHYTWDRVAEMTQNAYFEYLEQYPADNSRN